MKRVFAKLLSTPTEPAPVKWAITSISVFDDPEVADLLIGNWKNFGPEARDLVLDGLLNHLGRAQQLLSALETRQIETAAFHSDEVEKLLQDPDGRLRKWTAQSKLS